jgi:uncharacterized protein (DUF1684 family)
MRPQDQDYEKRLTDWRREMDDHLTREDGWLALVGLHWLDEGANDIGSDPAAKVPLAYAAGPPRLGEITLTAGRAALTVAEDAGVEVRVDGAPVSRADLRDDHHDDGPSKVQIDSLMFTIIKRGDAYAVRVRDRNAPRRKTFGGRAWFPIDPNFRVEARFDPFADAPREYRIDNTVGQQIPIESPGVITFALDGQPFELIAFPGGEDGLLWFIFRDATSGRQTYGACRFLYAALADDGRVDLDFNRAYHPPCAFTPYATCPLPPPGNVLPLAITAGERLPQPESELS